MCVHMHVKNSRLGPLCVLAYTASLIPRPVEGGLGMGLAVYSINYSYHLKSCYFSCTNHSANLFLSI